MLRVSLRASRGLARSIRNISIAATGLQCAGSLTGNALVSEKTDCVETLSSIVEGSW